MTRHQDALFITAFAIALLGSSTLACGAAPTDDDRASDESSGDALRRKKPTPPPAALPGSLRDGRYVIRGAALTSATRLGAVIIDQHDGARVVEIRTPLASSLTNVPVNADGSFTATYKTSPHSQFRYDGRVDFDGETLRFELTETEVAPGWSGASYRGQIGLGSVLVQEAASNGGRFAAGVRTQKLLASWSTGYPTISELVAFRTSSGRTFVTEPDALAGKGCLFGYALELPTTSTASSPAVATLATATGGTCGDWDACNPHQYARLAVLPAALSYSCYDGGESHSLQTTLPAFGP